MKIFLNCIVALLLTFVSISASAQEHEYEDSITASSDCIFTDTLYTNILPYPQRAIERLDSLMRNKMFETSQVGLMVYDLDADSLLYAHNERQLMRPASTMKLLTAITALDRLGKNYRYSTSVYYSGTCDSTTLRGNIYVKGGMDPSLEYFDLDCIVEGIAQLKIDTIAGDILGDYSFKDSKLLGEGWCWDDDNPVLSPLVFKRGDNMMSILLQKIREQGIIVLGSAGSGTVPPDAVSIITRYSAIEPILTKMMKDSDNLYAESMLYQIGALSGGTSTAKAAQREERGVIERAGLNPSRYRLADGSGLSLYNYLSAECEVMLLRYAYNNKDIFGTLCQSLPYAGEDGTLKKRMRNGAALGKVMAKTGTLAGIYTLAGYCISPENHVLAFCILNQGVMHGANARLFQDQVCDALCR
jgi:D-alanyl-D-alanine carboxypeptidase/D-alanyl-D-alanine-endopeptidase (penicillin-binding protein 4)